MPITEADAVENRAAKRNPWGVSPVQRVVRRRKVPRWSGFRRGKPPVCAAA